MATDLEAVGYVMLQLSLIGHPEYGLLADRCHPYSLRAHWKSLLNAVQESRGSDWKQMIEKMLGESFLAERPTFMREMLLALRNMLNQPVKEFVWSSETNLVQDIEPAQQTQSPHNFPESSVLVSWIEQGWEFFQQGNMQELTEICLNMLRLVSSGSPALFDQEAATSANQI